MKYNESDLPAVRRFLAHAHVLKQEISKLEDSFGESLLNGAMAMPFITEHCSAILVATQEAKETLSLRIHYYEKLRLDMEKAKVEQLGLPASIQPKVSLHNVSNYLASLKTTPIKES